MNKRYVSSSDTRNRQLLLNLLIEDAHNRGIKHISLEATAMGRPLYEKFGFVQMENEMELPR